MYKTKKGILIISLIMALCLILCYIIYYFNAPKKWSDFFGNEKLKSLGVIQNIDHIKNCNINDLSVYNIDDFHDMIYENPYYKSIPERSSETSSLVLINKKTPIEFIKKIDDFHIIIARKAIWCDKIILIYNVMEKYMLPEIEKNEYWGRTGELYIVSYEKSSYDFKDINVGDNLDKVLSIDYSVQFEMELCMRNLGKLRSYRVLSDGIMIIECDVESETVILKKFLPYGYECDDEYITILNYQNCIEYLK